MSKKVHYANFESSPITKREMRSYISDLEIYRGISMTMEEVAINAMMQGLQRINMIDMAKHPYPKGLVLKKSIYRLSQNLSIAIANIKLRYTDKSPVPAMDKYRVILEFGLEILKKDMADFKKEYEAAKLEETNG